MAAKFLEGATLSEVKTKFKKYKVGDTLKGKVKKKVVGVFPHFLLTERPAKDGQVIRECFTYADLYTKRVIK